MARASQVLTRTSHWKRFKAGILPESRYFSDLFYHLCLSFLRSLYGPEGVVQVLLPIAFQKTSKRKKEKQGKGVTTWLFTRAFGNCHLTFVCIPLYKLWPVVTLNCEGGQRAEVFWEGRYTEKIWKKEMLIKKKRKATRVQLRVLHGIYC